MHIFMIILIGLVAASCSSNSVSKKACASANWVAEGYADGLNGLAANQESDFTVACSLRGFSFKSVDYSKGRLEGLAAFCRPSQAYAIGLKGQPYPSNCRRYDESNFRAAYQRGFMRYTHLTNAWETKEKLEFATQKLAAVNTQLEKYRDKKPRRRAKAEKHALLVSALEVQKEALETSIIPKLERGVAAAQNQLMAYDLREIGAPVPGAYTRPAAIASAAGR